MQPRPTGSLTALRIGSFPEPVRPTVHRLVWSLLPALFLVAASMPLPALGQDPPGEAGWEDVPIRAGDVIRLAVWREAEYTGDFPVDARGTATLPLVGEWNVAGLAPSELRRRLTEAYSRTLREPILYLEVLRRVRVLGSVMRPGVFHLDPTMSVADALATAGGRTPLAREGDLILRRGDEVLRADVRVDALLAELRIQSGDELYVPQRSWVDRNAPPIISGVIGLIGVAIAVFAR
jgi:protein involved in polysaccharide export with SLBB domain